MVKYYNGEMYTIPKAFEEEIRADERAKVLDDFKKLIEKRQTTTESYSSPPCFDMGVDMVDILEIIAQLKEQKNERSTDT